MQELVLVGFRNDRCRAAAVLEELREMEEPWTAELRDALAVYRDERGTFIVDRSEEPSWTAMAIGGAIVGALVGFALGLVAMPFTSLAVAGGALVAGGLTGLVLGIWRDEQAPSWWNELAVPRELRAAVRRNDSAIFIRCPIERQDEVVHHVRRLVAVAEVRTCVQERARITPRRSA